MPVTERVELLGHVLDTGQYARVLNAILGAGADYVIERFDVGKRSEDDSAVRMAVTADNQDELQELLGRLQAYGVNLIDPGVLRLVTADLDGVFPEHFYSTTNLETRLRIGDTWVRMENPEMDCGIVVTDGRARTVPMSDVRVGDQIVCGASGVRVEMPPRPRSEESSFEFMNSVVSSEKPQALQVRQLADDLRAVKAAGQRILWVGGPAVVHTGAAPAMTALVRAGYVHVLFAGNALATHDIESSMYGTSLGVDLSKGSGVEHGHEHHIRAINRIRRAGSIRAAVEQGVLTSGVMHALVEADADWVLVGSVRDDGPLPDVITDVIEGQRAMRAQLPNVGYAIMVATMLHAIATGNILPAAIPLLCVDINPATVTKLADRGSAQAVGVVTDIGLFLEQLATELVPGYRSGG